MDEFINTNFKTFVTTTESEANFEIIDKNSNSEINSNKVDLKLKNCDTYGTIKFNGYANICADHKPNFIRFNSPNENTPREEIHKLIIDYWKFAQPKLLISVNGGFKRMNFKTNQQKTNFKQGLIEVIKKDTTWIIGSGFNVGIHKLVSEAVQDYRLLYENNENQVKLIGISTWGVVKDNHCITSKESDYNYNNTIEKGKVTLNANYDCFLFCDDGTEKQYDKEIDFRLNFEKTVQERGAFAVQILYEGGRRALESVHRLLKERIPLVVIKDSGRSADIICEILELEGKSFDMKKYEEILQLKDEDLEKFKQILPDFYQLYKKWIFIHDLSDPNVNLDKKILEAIISSQDDENLKKTLSLSIRFNCPDIADVKVFQSSNVSSLDQNTLNENFEEILITNQWEFVQLFLENNFNIEGFLTETVLGNLYTKLLQSNNCRCTDLICDLVLRTDKLFMLDDKKCQGNLICIIYKIICDLSGNILKTGSFGMDNCANSHLYSNPQRNRNKITLQDLFLWALLSGYSELSLIFWRNGRDHVGSALIGSIIIDKMRKLILRKGYNDMSEKLTDMSQKFQELAITVVKEAYSINQEKTNIILTRALNNWNNMTCLQIAISGGLLDFLNVNACRSYTREAWMGDLSPFLPNWKIFLTIPFSILLIKSLIIPSFSYNKNPAKKLVTRRNYGENKNCTKTFSISDQKDPMKNKSLYSNVSLSENEVESSIKYVDAFTKFYQVPFVKFVIYLSSYSIFLLIFIYLNLVKLKPINELKIVDTWSEIIVYLYVIGFIVEEIKQITSIDKIGYCNKLTTYLSGSWNKFDLFTILIFIISFITRFVIPKELFIIARCFFGLTLSMFVVRSMQFFFINRAIGPKVIMIRKMIVDIFFFLSIFSLFIISYGTFSHSLQHPNCEWNLELIKDVIYRPYFQTYGELMLDEFNVTFPCYSTACIIKNVTLYTGFGVFLLMTNILLVNLLIAMFGYTFNKIQGESEKFFSYVHIQLVDEFFAKSLVPPPLNLVYYLLIILWKIPKTMFCNESTRKDTFLVKYLTEDENIKVAGFEHLCVESSVLDDQCSKIIDKQISTFEKLLNVILENVENINNQLENKSAKNLLVASQLNAIEKSLQQILLK